MVFEVTQTLQGSDSSYPGKSVASYIHICYNTALPLWGTLNNKILCLTIQAPGPDRQTHFAGVLKPHATRKTTETLCLMKGRENSVKFKKSKEAQKCQTRYKGELGLKG